MAASMRIYLVEGIIITVTVSSLKLLWEIPRCGSTGSYNGGAIKRWRGVTSTKSSKAGLDGVTQ
jgi:hypothetical protein